MEALDRLEAQLARVNAPVRASVETLNTPEAIAHLQAFEAQMKGATAQAETLSRAVKAVGGTTTITLLTAGADQTLAQLQQVGVTSRALQGEGGKVNLNIAATGGPQTEEQLRAIAAAARDATERGKVTIQLSAVGAAQVGEQLAAVEAAAAGLKDQNIAFKIDTTGAVEAAAAAKEEAAARKESLALSREQAVAEREQAAAQQARVAELRQASQVGGRSIAGIPLNAAAPLALAGGAFAVGEQATDQGTLFSQLQANTTLTDGEMAKVAAGIKEIAASPAPIEEIATAFRHVTNEGFSAGDALTIVKEAEMSAVSTGAQLGQVGNALAIVMHDFSLPAAQAGEAINVLHLAAARGNVTLEEFATASAKVWADAGRLGVSLVDAAGAMSALTQAGYSAPQAATLLDGLMTKIINATPAAKKEIEALSKATGVDLTTDFTQAGLAARGLPAVLDDIQRATRGNAEEMFKLLPALRGGRGEMALTSETGINFRATLDALADTFAGKTNPTAEAYARALGLTSSQLAIFANQLRLAAGALGQEVVPAATKALEALNALGGAPLKAAMELGLALAALKTAMVIGGVVDGAVAALGRETAAIEGETVAIEANVAARRGLSAAGLLTGAVAGVGLAYGAEQVDKAMVAPAAKELADRQLRDINQQISNGQSTLDDQLAAQQRIAAGMKRADDKGPLGLPNPEIPGVGRPFPTGLTPVDAAGSNGYSDTQIAAQQRVVAALEERRRAEQEALASAPAGAIDKQAQADLFVGPKQLSDEEQANLVEHQAQVDQRRADLAAKGVPQHLIDVSTDEGGTFSKADKAIANRDIAEAERTNAALAAQRKAAADAYYTDQKQHVADLAAAQKQAVEEDATRRKQAVQDAAAEQERAATQTAEAWKAAASAVGNIEKARTPDAIGASAEGLEKARGALFALGQANPALDALSAIADKFKGIADATEQAKAAFTGYMLTLTETDKATAQLDSIQKRYLEALDAAEKRQKAGTSTADDDRLVASRAGVLDTFAQQQQGLSKNAAADVLAIVQHLPDFVAIDNLQRQTIAQMGGGAKVLGDIQAQTAKADTDLAALEAAARAAADAIKANATDALQEIDRQTKQTVATIGDAAKEATRQIDDLMKPRDLTLTVHTAQVGIMPGGASPYDEPNTGGNLPAGDGSTATPRGDAAALGPLAPLIQKYAAQYGVPAWELGAIIMHESGGEVGKREVGGGDGHGLTQIDTGPYGGNAYDPRLDRTDAVGADYQVQQGAKVLADKIAGAGSIEQGTQNYAGPAYRSQAAGGVPGGLDLYTELATYYKAQVEKALAAGGALDPTRGYGGGGYTPGQVAASEHLTTQQSLDQRGDFAANPAVAAGGGGVEDAIFLDAQKHLGDKFNRFGQDVYGKCEQIVGDIMQEATGKDARWPTADAHVRAAMAGQPGAGTIIDRAAARPGDLVGLTGDTPAAGDPAGHIGVYAGGNQYIGTTPNGVQARAIPPGAVFIRPDGVVSNGPVPGSVLHTAAASAPPAAQGAPTVPNIPTVDGTKGGVAQATVSANDLTAALARADAAMQALDKEGLAGTKAAFAGILPALTQMQEKAAQIGDTPLTDTEKQQAAAAAWRQGLQYATDFAAVVTGLEAGTLSVDAATRTLAADVGGPLAAAYGRAGAAQAQIAAANGAIADLTKQHDATVAARQAEDQASQRAATTAGWAQQDASAAMQARQQAAQERLADRTTAENDRYQRVQRDEQDRQRQLQFSQQVQATDLQNKLTDTQKQQQSTVYQRTSEEQLQAASVKGAGTNAEAGLRAAALAAMHDQDLKQKDLNTRAIDDIQLQIREEARKANLDSYNLQTETIAEQRKHEDILRNLAAQGTAQQRTFQAEQQAESQHQQAIQRSTQMQQWQEQDRRQAEDAALKAAVDAQKQIALSAQASLDAANQSLSVWQQTGAVVGAAAQAAAANPFPSSPVGAPGSGTIRRLAGFAAGGVLGDAPALVGDGPGGEITPYTEVVHAPGRVVTPLGALAGAGGGGPTFNITLNAESLTEAQVDDLTRQFNGKLQELRRTLATAHRDRAAALGRR